MKGGVSITQDDFTNGVYKITESGTYNLTANVTGSIVVNDDKAAASKVTLNLNGHTLTCNSSDEEAIDTAMLASLTINGGSSAEDTKLGSIVSKGSTGAIRFDSTYDERMLTINNVNVTAESNQCLQLINGYATLNNVSMTSNGGDSVIYCDCPSNLNKVTINSGSFNASGSAKSMFKIVKGSQVILNGGFYSRIPDGCGTDSAGVSLVSPVMGDDRAMFKAEGDNALYEVRSLSEVKGSSVYKVALDSDRAVYFASEAEAGACAEDVSGAKLVKLITVKFSGLENLVYNGAAKEAKAELSGVASGDEVKPKLEYQQGGSKVEEAVNAGNYKVVAAWLEGTNAGSYELKGETTASFEIAKAEANIKVATPGTKTVGDAAFNLNAKADTAATLEYGSSNKAVAEVDETGQVVVKAAGTTILTVSAEATDNYKQSEASVELKVKAADLSAAKVTLSKTSFTYNGKAQKPSVKSVVLNGKTLEAGSDYTANVASGKKVGTYKVTVTAKGTYAGKATASFTVNPKGVTKFKVSKAKKSFKAKWAKNKTERSGVQLKYSTKKSMANAKTVKAKGASAKAKTVKKLKKKTKYYVQVRAYKVVGGKTYYSGWSAKKAVKTK
ncbi:MAG: MBG domain-containing protein [Coriobacteriia bacterium]|nr:MBG domain-containing protein [Coriobacteriia bacterium]